MHVSFSWSCIVLFTGCILKSTVGKVEQQPRLGVLVHGCNTKAKGWERIAWGDVAQSRMGRISHTIALVSMFRSLELMNVDLSIATTSTLPALVCVLWGSGVPSHESGLTEGQYTMGIMRDKFGLLRLFPFFQDMSGLREEQLERLVLSVSSSEDSSVNTVTEIEAAFKEFKRLAVNVILLVSSATHAPRCLRDASKVLEKWNKIDDEWHPLLLVSPASTCYDGYSAEDVVIAEPPHLPSTFACLSAGTDQSDLSGVEASVANDPSPLCNLRTRNSLISNILDVPQDRLSAFNFDLERLLRRYLDTDN